MLCRGLPATHPPYVWPHGLIESTHLVPQSVVVGSVVGGSVLMIEQGGGVKVGQGVQSGKHPPYI